MSNPLDDPQHPAHRRPTFREDPPVIDNVSRFPNGMVMVFDAAGEQMPDYQGRWVEKKEAILRDKPDHVEVERWQRI